MDDCKILHVSPKVINDMIAWLHQEYKSIFTDGSGKMKVARGKVHKVPWHDVRLRYSKVSEGHDD